MILQTITDSLSEEIMLLVLRLGSTAILLFFLTASGGAEVYDVGDGLTYPAIGAVPWEALAAGDTVNIHHRPAAYHEKWVLCRQGTSEDPIVVRGIASAAGELPVVSGEDATTRSALNFWDEERGVIKIGGANQPPDTLPAHIIIENLDVRSGRPPYTFTGRYGLTSYVNNCAAIYIEKGKHIVIRGCTLRDCGNGLFCGHQTSDLVVEANWIYDNGIENHIYEHNNYTEAYGILFQFNHFGPLRAHCSGNNLKDRSAGTIIRYNWIEGGNRQLDLVDSDYAAFYADSLYRQTFVYGNILIEPDSAGNSQILHYGGDSGATERYRKGTLYLHNNTIVSTRSGNTTLARLSTMEEICDARNNIIYTTAAGSYLAMLSESGGILHLRQNWLMAGWVPCHGSTPGVVHDHGSIAGLEPGFCGMTAQDFELVEDSPCIDAGTDLDPGIAALHTPGCEYVRRALSRPRPIDGAIDIGAYEYCPSAGVRPPDTPRETITLLAWPNPAHRNATLSFELPAPAYGELVIQDLMGRSIRHLLAQHLSAGPRQVNWDGCDDAGRHVPQGLYLLRLETAGRQSTCPVILLHQ